MYMSTDFKGLITKVTITRAFQIWNKLALEPYLPQDGNHIKILLQLNFFFLCFKFFFYAIDFGGFVTKVLSVLNIKRKKFISKIPHYFVQGKLLALHYDMWDSKELRNLDWSFREELYWISNFLFYATNIVYNQRIVTKKPHQNLNIWQYTSVNILLLFSL